MAAMKTWCLALLIPAVFSLGCVEGPEAASPEPVRESESALATVSFSGTVRDPEGRPIAAASVVINGIARTTDTSGRYFLALPSTTNGYIVNVSKTGFAPLTRYLSGGTLNSVLVLPRATVRQFSATQPIAFETADVQVNIPAGSLVDAAGRPVTGTVLVSVASYAPLAMPGDFTAVNSKGQTVALESVGAFFIGATDSTGAAVNLGRDRTAQVVLRVPQQVGRMPPCVFENRCRLAMWRFDGTINRWVEQRANLSAGTASTTFTLIGGPPSTPSSVLPTNGGLGTWNADLEFTTPACTIVELVGFPLACYNPAGAPVEPGITVNLQLQNAANTWIPKTDTVTSSIPFFVIYNSRPFVEQEVGISFPPGAPASCGNWPTNFNITSTPAPTDPTYPLYTGTGGFTRFDSGAPWGGIGFPDKVNTPGVDIDFGDIPGNHPCNSTVTFTYTP
ncbi:carboxypeptidase regulatory-like domain-containing protein [Pyxidicoccus fallax]|uniref:Carboxypeptidase regulatory-like domain-containing protein n=1 Tax=Pyxidicoccus fallax TaxID=394095 RepID=A0A848LKB4_9BACT|nr:carboxypeptidase-like regulatory domain-containing protein [Pyxidicoccus fallax]NMO18104.1 carboxypeptidase regulatory-like domain-containing protein [Pyxidicoccus fallax]NPC80348.1 carboxypeptidase regulatory-like domain-containing protein [Pyxidicoccus fallax]